MNLIESLSWRYATKKYSGRKLPEDTLQQIVEAVSLSASSAGLQPYRLIVIENPEFRKELAEGSRNPQIAEASHLLVFAAYSAIRKDHIEKYVHLTAEVRGVAEESLADFKDSLTNHLLSKTDEENFIWSAKQAYIALGTGLIAAANLQVDATPMEGFDAEKFDEVLGLEEKGLKSVVLLALGYRDEENDFLANLKKVRFPKEEFVIKIL